MLKQMSKQDYLLDFVSWVNDQPDHRHYTFCNTYSCPVGLYFQERLGISTNDPEFAKAWNEGHPLVDVTHHENYDVSAALSYDWILGQQTFGALKKRLAAIQFIGA